MHESCQMSKIDSIITKIYDKRKVVTDICKYSIHLGLPTSWLYFEQTMHDTMNRESNKM